MSETDNLIPFTPREAPKARQPKGLPSEQQCGVVMDSEANRMRDGQGPPINSVAWFCLCGSAAFYVTPSSMHCYVCHKEPVWP